MLFYLGFLSALFIVLIYANYTLYITNKELKKRTDFLMDKDIAFKNAITKLQDDVTTLRMKR